ncbi:hypothetical protein ABQE57_00855 [Mycolicibacterium elephantis]
MVTPATEAASRTGARPPWPRLWLAAGAEIGVAVIVAVILFRSTIASSSADPHFGAHAHPYMAQAHWSPAIVVAGAATAALFLWWVVTRNRVSAVLTAVGLVAVAGSQPARVIALQSHLVGMLMLEAVLVAVPLLLLSTRQIRPATAPVRSPVWVVLVAGAVAGYSALLIALHLPSVHGATGLRGVPLWLVALTLGVGIAYWAAILLTAGRVTTKVRLRALLLGQEVGAVLGLAAVILPLPIMVHDNVFGLSGVTDQRLGGVVMLLTCAAVTLPLARHIQRSQAGPNSRTDCNVQ